MGDEKVYEVEFIVRERVRRGKKEYLCRWKGWGEKDDTWEPASNWDEGLDQALQNFERKKTESKRNKRRTPKKKATAPKRNRSVERKSGKRISKRRVSRRLSSNRKLKKFKEDAEQSKTIAADNAPGRVPELRELADAKESSTDANESENSASLYDACTIL
mmetsp:Transcript_9427/g.23213  ORF Transcript_9427/g.23213 Transcript_9427/m.23213 type:complete len:161 (-) Transcript_9427:308-790(-)|eukprot:CAMPEP_0114507496 /NCGR_PEP_ID=MMETSP0109-20121206/12044_1 /TAXON_ID=29199 /ORGANISM="Chlorarachnion reptans, Strain CCCM449" /LENGTH=160 /DNA_ID=CAMNT_0001686259 /DNA_START=321 /DNA_END=803 /DNA_ORIENTATION=+